MPRLQGARWCDGADKLYDAKGNGSGIAEKWLLLSRNDVEALVDLPASPRQRRVEAAERLQGLFPRSEQFFAVRLLEDEWQYQARVFRESLYLKLHSTYRLTTATQQFRFFSGMANRTTEFVWQHTLPHQRALIPRRPVSSGNPINTFGDVVLPEFGRDVLGMGPKFAVPPRSSAPELVTYVRQVSRLANEAQTDIQIVLEVGFTSPVRSL
ncbi:hypothetical protein HPB52_013310 [Rhipicephalus sanguineus]|uniref:Uncharacterized protein n=1 Tax=Rhipicephalus sanguineus TaxID=34632 RepID=A0A9D4YPQ2_RHISA|nr:hypothetical protein HPB52_013310 [Rhipicephalus sanguineus]